jgi:hypothetical protein
VQRCEAKRPAAISVGKALAEAAAGKTVRIAGTLDLLSIGTTLVLCHPGDCCNETQADLRIRPTPSGSTPRRPYSGISLLLSINCRGDDSLVCCGYELGKPVEITGTWKHDATRREPQWVVESVSVCAP